MRIKEYLEQLEDKVRQLEKEVETLKAQKAAGQADGDGKTGTGKRAAAPKAKQATK